MNFVSKQTFSLGLAFVLLISVLAFESCSTSDLNLPCKKGEWYQSTIKSETIEKPLNVSVKFKEDYALVELMNAEIHEVYKLHSSEDNTDNNQILFETGEKNYRYNNAVLKLVKNKTETNENQITISFEDFDTKLKCDNHSLGLKKG